MVDITTNNTLDLSIIIPMFNEEDNVTPLVNEIVAAMIEHPNYEIIIIDDASTDATYKNARQLQQEIPQLIVLRHQQNAGQSAAIVTGVRHAKYTWIATLDGDGQNNPADIQKLLNILQSELQQQSTPLLIAGNRGKRQDTWLRKASSRIANHVRTSLLKDDCLDTGCSLKIFPRDTFLQLPHFKHLHRFLPSLFKRAGVQIVNVPVDHRPRLTGQSKYGIKNRLFVGIFDLMGVMWLMRRPCSMEIEREHDTR